MKHDFLYSVEREVNHSLETLWRAFTETAALQSWYHPTDLNVAAGTAISEAHVGGKWQIAIEVPDGSTHCFYGHYTHVESQKYLEHTMHYTVAIDEMKKFDETTPFHIVKIRFEDHDGKGYVHWSQFGELPEGQAEMAQAGMNSYLDSLEQYLG